MNQAMIRAPQEYSKAALSLAPVASNSPQNHASVDRLGYRSAIVDIAFSASGVPTGGTLSAKIQDSADGTTFADLVVDGVAVAASLAITTGNAASGAVLSLPAHLGAARRFVRAVTTGAPTGGTSPVVSAAAVMRLYGPDTLPAR